MLNGFLTVIWVQLDQLVSLAIIRRLSKTKTIRVYIVHFSLSVVMVNAKCNLMAPYHSDLQRAIKLSTMFHNAQNQKT